MTGCRFATRVGEIGLRPGGVTFLVAVCLLAAPVLAQSKATPAMKGEFLLTFLKFMEWPGEGGSTAPITVGVFGQDPFAQAVRGLDGQKAGDRQVQVRPLTDPAGGKGYHVVVVSQAEAGRISAVLSATKGSKALTVSDSGGFAQAGGMLELLAETDSVHFKVNLNAARQNNVMICSQLLEMAAEVIGR